MNGGCYCALGKFPCDCGLLHDRGMPVLQVEDEWPWLYLVYALAVVLGIALPAVIWSA